MEMSIENIKNDYIDGISHLLHYFKNKLKVQNITFQKDYKLGKRAVADVENNTITYGPDADEITIFHELERIRKGNLTINSGEDIRIDERTGRLIIKKPRYGMFMEDAISECMAIGLFKHSDNFEFEKDGYKIEQRILQSLGMKMIETLCNILKISDLELCELIELKHYSKNNAIDIIFNNTIKGMTFSEFEAALDLYATVCYFNCKYNKSCSNELLTAANQEFMRVNNILRQNQLSKRK